MLEAVDVGDEDSAAVCANAVDAMVVVRSRMSVARVESAMRLCENIRNLQKDFFEVRMK
jgi:hypothetical protein